MIEMERRTTKLNTTLVNKTLKVETADQIAGDTMRTSASKSFTPNLEGFQVVIEILYLVH